MIPSAYFSAITIYGSIFLPHFTSKLPNPPVWAIFSILFIPPLIPAGILEFRHNPPRISGIPGIKSEFLEFWMDSGWNPPRIHVI
jgi:hypothetical protein